MKTVAVIGAGLMGSQIALQAALSGFRVFLQDINETKLNETQTKLNEQLLKLVKKGIVSKEQWIKVTEQLVFETKLKQAVIDADIVIEAIIENLEAKQQLFSEVSSYISPTAILATNSSMIGSSKLASFAKNPENVCNIHFFNPVLKKEVVEVAIGPHTSNETANKAVEFVKHLNKTPLLLKKEVTGFIANRILSKIMDEAVYLVENGIASIEEVDLACTKALNHPIGPFALIDLTGLDTAYAIQKTQYLLGEALQKPSELLKSKVENGELGRKTGQGFYSYK